MRRRAWQRQGTSAHVELNVIPLIDVVFFLLVFYVISTSFVQETAVAIDRPSSSQATAVTSAYVPVAIVASGAVQIGAQLTDAAHVSPLLASALAQAGTTRVVVLADRAVPTGELLTVMDACRSGGATAVDVAATSGGER